MTDTPNIGKNPIIQFLSNIILNESGEEFFSKMGVPLKTLSGISGRKKMGFRAENIEVPFLKTLLRQNYLEEIYSSGVAFIDKKNDLQDITKLIFYGIIYSKFKPHLTHVLLSSDLVERYNYKNPTRKITHQTNFNETKIRSFFNERKLLIAKLINSILKKPFDLIENDPEIKEKNEKKMIMKTFVQHISFKEWFLFFLITNSQEERERVINQISDLLINYLGKTKISDYLGFLLVELLQNSEKSSLTKVINIKKLPTDDPEDYLKDKNNREKVKEIAKSMNYFIETSWKLKQLETNGNLSTIRYEITVSNRGVIPKHLRKKVKEKQNTETEGYSLASFYEDSGQTLGAGLGLYYISYLTEESKIQGIRFESNIESDDDKDTTYVYLRITI